MYRNKCYLVVTQTADWHSSLGHCESLGGTLVEVPDVETNNFLLDHLLRPYDSANAVVWIGLNDRNVEGTFVWTTGNDVTFKDFAPKEPNNVFWVPEGEDCVQILDGKWNDGNCHGLKMSVCERQ